MNDIIIDPAFMPIFKHINALKDIEQSSFSDELAGFRLYMDEMILEMPVEMDIKVDEKGGVHFGSAPPIYYANTSLQPVYHKMKIIIKKEGRE